VIYFILAALLIWIVNKIEVRAIPGRKSSRDAQKEVQER